MEVRLSKEKTTIVATIFIITLTLIVYHHVYNHGYINYDDPGYVYENLRVPRGITFDNVIWAFKSLDMFNWHPLTWISYMIDVDIFGFVPSGFHVMNIAIHALSAAVLFIFLNKVTLKPWRSLMVAILFSIHPLHVESVAWISERKDVLSGLFMHLSLLLYANYASHPTSKKYFAIIISYIAGLMAKPMLVTLPFLFILLDYWPLNRIAMKDAASGDKLNSNLSNIIKEKIPFIIIGAMSSVITIYAQHKGGSIASIEKIPIDLRIGNALISYGQYIINTLWPHDLSIFYPLTKTISTQTLSASILILIVLTVASIRSMSKSPWMIMGWFWYLITLLPVIGIIQVGEQAHADRYTYIPITGLFIMIIWEISDLLKSYNRSKIALIASGLIVSVFIFITMNRLPDWKDSITLYQKAIAVTPGNYLAHNNLGTMYSDEGKIKEAFEQFNTAIAIKPEYADAHYNLGLAFAKVGMIDDAISSFNNALNYSPQFANAYYNRGVLLVRQGLLAKAIPDFQKSVSLNPYDYDGYNELGIAYSDLGDLNMAIYYLQKAISVNPKMAKAYGYLGIAYAREGLFNQAIIMFDKTIAIDSRYSSAYFNRGLAFAKIGDMQRAVADFKAACQLGDQRGCKQSQLNDKGHKP